MSVEHQHAKRARSAQPAAVEDDVLFHKLLQQARDTPPVHVWNIAEVARQFSQLRTPIPMVIEYLHARPELLQRMAETSHQSIGALLRTSDDDPEFTFAQPLKALARMYLCMLHDSNWESGQEEKEDIDAILRFSTPDIRFLVPGTICIRQQADRIAALVGRVLPELPETVIREILVPYVIH